MSGGSMLRTRRKDVNIKPNRRLDRKSSRGMLYENEELRLRTININAEVERGQTDIKKLKRENEQLRREVGALRGEYDRLEKLLKARHMEELSDEEGSLSCCSECESECCYVQNDANMAYDVKEESPQGNHSKIASIPENNTNKELPCRDDSVEIVKKIVLNDFLPSVPEELPLQESHLHNFPSIPSDDFPASPSAIHLQNCFHSIPKTASENCRTSIATVPLVSEPSEINAPYLPRTLIFPKAELDILINNNDNNIEKSFQNLSKIEPPKNKAIDPSLSHKNIQSNDVIQDANMQHLEDDNNFEALHLIPMQNVENDKNNMYIQNFLNYINPTIENASNDCLKNSVFICNTKKIIQQLALHDPNMIQGIASDFKLNNAMTNNLSDSALENDATVEIDDDRKSFKTEKKIELYYDYPKTIIGENSQHEQNLAVNTNSEKKSLFMPKVLQSTTELNSTVMMFESKAINEQMYSKFHPFFKQSHSTSDKILPNDPIYATVNKLPKKLGHLHIKNLENEISYVPNDETNVNRIHQTVQNGNLIIPNKSQYAEIQSNNELKHSEHSQENFNKQDKSVVDPSLNTIPKTPIMRKKKRFSLHFKRKNKKNNIPMIKQPDMITESKLNQMGTKNNSDKNIGQTLNFESLDSDSVKRNDVSECKKYRHSSKHSTHALGKTKHSASNCDCHRYHCEKGLAHRLKDSDFTKIKHNPVELYLRNDQDFAASYSERERTNSLSSSVRSGSSFKNKEKKIQSTQKESSVPWCGCWGNSCL